MPWTRAAGPARWTLHGSDRRRALVIAAVINLALVVTPHSRPYPDRCAAVLVGAVGATTQDIVIDAWRIEIRQALPMQTGLDVGYAFGIAAHCMMSASGDLTIAQRIALALVPAAARGLGAG